MLESSAEADLGSSLVRRRCSMKRRIRFEFSMRQRAPRKMNVEALGSIRVKVMQQHEFDGCRRFAQTAMCQTAYGKRLRTQRED